MNVHSMPRISIVTPSYNQGPFIEETIQSVLLQEYPNFEYIIIDGGSTDHTQEIIKKYESQLTYWISEPDRGQSHAINKGIQKATGDIVFWLNSDDICLPGAFRRVAMTFQADPTVALVTGQTQVINEQGKMIGELRSDFSSWDELVTNPRNSVRQISTFFSRRLFDELGYVDESLHIAMDTELMVRFTQFHSPRILNEYLTAYRVHSGAKTQQQLIRGYEETDRVRPKYLSTKTLVSRYNKRSAANWLSLSESRKFPIMERVVCLMHAVQNLPWILFSGNFRSALKKLLIDCYAAINPLNYEKT